MLDPANIIRCNRNTVAIYIDERGTLIVKAPLKLPAAKIYQFVKEKEDWIRRQQKRATQNAYLNYAVMSYNAFLFLGATLNPYVTNNAKSITRSEDLLCIPPKIADAGEEATLKKIDKWYRVAAKQILVDRCLYFSQRMRLQHTRIDINNNKTRWGVCGANGDIALNWRCVMLPPKLIDYIVVHEYCHLLEFNHTKNFWQLVESILPDWRNLRKELKQYAWILGLFRKAK